MMIQLILIFETIENEQLRKNCIDRLMELDMRHTAFNIMMDAIEIIREEREKLNER